MWATVSRDCWLQKWQRILRRSSGMAGDFVCVVCSNAQAQAQAHPRHRAESGLGWRDTGTFLPPPWLARVDRGRGSRNADTDTQTTKVLGLVLLLLLFDVHRHHLAAPALPNTVHRPPPTASNTVGSVQHRR